MKKYTVYKTVQLVLFLALAAAVLAWAFPSKDVYHQIATDPSVRFLAMIVWVALLVAFVFILMDYLFFFNYLKEYKEMDIAVHSDPLSGIANRFSCDIMIERYLDKPLPDNIGAIMFEMTNIQEINRLYGHLQGNMAIRDFSNILRLSSDSLCFVGRNGGNKFLAIFEECKPEDMDRFLGRVQQRVVNHNRDIANSPLEYSFGEAFSGTDSVPEGITQLISLANSRIQK